MPILTILLALALLSSGCTEVEEPLPLRPVDSRSVTGGRISHSYGEVRAPKGAKTLTLKASSALGAPVESVPGEEGFTRAVIEPDSEGAAVLWEAGDSIRVQFLRDGALYYAWLWTEEGGSSEAVFTTDYDILGGTDYIFFTPGYAECWETNEHTGGRIFGVVIPPSQSAVADGVASGASLAFTRSDSFEDGMSLSFANLPALLRFRLSGGVVSQVSEITLRTTSPVAGESVVYDADGVPSYHPRPKVAGDNYSSVTLSGEFEAGKEYHIALWPQEIGYLEMEFSDGEGNFTTLRSSNGLSLARSVVTDIGTIELGDSFRGLGDISTTPVKYMSKTEGTKPVSVVVIPDGFTLRELPLYESLAKMAYDFLFDTEPYKTYKNRFNAWILKVASNESGAGITDGNNNVITPVDNYFGSRWGADSYSDMTADNDKIFNFVQSNCPDIKSKIHNIDEVPIIVLVNDSRYGGKATFWNVGRGRCIIPWTYKGLKSFWRYPKVIPLSDSEPNGEWRDPTEDDFDLIGRSSGDWRNAVVHEFGHVFGRLTDEYFVKPPTTATSAKIEQINSRHSWVVPYGRNVSASYSETPWDELLSRKDELVERDERYSRIGKYQGGMNCTFGVWRSEFISGMMDNRLYFGAWSRYLIVERIMKLSGDESLFNFDYWLARDVTADPLRDGDGEGLGTRSAYRSPYRLQEPYYPEIWEESIPCAPPEAIEE